MLRVHSGGTAAEREMLASARTGCTGRFTAQSLERIGKERSH